MFLVNVPAYLHRHRTEVVAIYPVLISFVLEVLAVAEWQYHVPERLERGRLLLRDKHMVFVIVFRAAKLRHMLNAANHEEALLWVRAEVQVFLVIERTLRVAVVNLFSRTLEHVFFVLVVHELAVAEVKMHLQPVVGEGHRPEVFRADMNLRNRLGVVSLRKGT